jgi:hypothetical protein
VYPCVRARVFPCAFVGARAHVHVTCSRSSCDGALPSGTAWRRTERSETPVTEPCSIDVLVVPSNLRLQLMTPPAWKTQLPLSSAVNTRRVASIGHATETSICASLNVILSATTCGAV